MWKYLWSFWSSTKVESTPVAAIENKAIPATKGNSTSTASTATIAPPTAPFSPTLPGTPPSAPVLLKTPKTDNKYEDSDLSLSELSSCDGQRQEEAAPPTAAISTTISATSATVPASMASMLTPITPHLATVVKAPASPLVLRTMSLTALPKGCRVMLVGRRQSGKTTLIKTILAAHRDIPIGAVITQPLNFDTYRIPDNNPFFFKQLRPGMITGMLREQGRAIRKHQKEVEDKAEHPEKPIISNPNTYFVLEEPLLYGQESRSVVESMVRALQHPLHKPYLTLCLSQQIYTTVPPMLREEFDWLVVPLRTLRDTLREDSLEFRNRQLLRREWLPNWSEERWESLLAASSQPSVTAFQWLVINRPSGQVWKYQA